MATTDFAGTELTFALAGQTMTLTRKKVILFCCGGSEKHRRAVSAWVNAPAGAQRTQAFEHLKWVFPPADQIFTPGFYIVIEARTQAGETIKYAGTDLEAARKAAQSGFYARGLIDGRRLAMTWEPYGKGVVVEVPE